MPPLSSQDILYIALAICALTLTGFLCWLIFYATQILKSTSAMVNELRDRLLSITSMLSDVIAKLERVYDMVNSFSGLGDFFKKKVQAKAASIFGKKTTEEPMESDDDSAEAAVEETLARTNAKKSARRFLKVRS